MAGKFSTLPMRIAVAIVLIAIVVSTLVYSRWLFVAFVGLLLALSCYEIANAAKKLGRDPVWIPIAVASPIFLLCEYGIRIDQEIPIPFLYIGPIGSIAELFVIALVFRLGRGVSGYLSDVAISAFMLLYLALMGQFIVRMVATDKPVAIVLTYLACIALGDTGAYIFGSLFGKHKLAPDISPGKTVEGLIGGLLLAGTAGALLVPWLIASNWIYGAVSGVILGGLGALGDLVESAIKRDVGIKDMSQILPGHGGVLDRIDAMIFCAPFGYALLGTF
jgi:phosphatidate cytidylyltransferase